MQHSVRVLIAASAYALATGGKVAGIHDHQAGQALRVAAEARAGHLQGYDGDRDVRFAGILPEVTIAGESASVHMRVEGDGVAGYDRGSATHFVTRIAGTTVQLYDHAAAAWFAFTVQAA